MQLIAAMTLGLLVATGCASRADLDRVAEEAAHQQRVAAQYRKRANNAEAQLRQMQAELRKAKQQVKRAKKACQPAKSRPPASKGSEIENEAIENCVRRMIARDGGSPREWRTACGNIGRGGFVRGDQRGGLLAIYGNSLLSLDPGEATGR